MFISTLVFSLLLNRLKQYDLKILSFVNKIPSKWKGKWYIRWLFIILLLMITAPIVVYGGLSDMAGYIIAGFILSISDFAFRKTKKEIND